MRSTATTTKCDARLQGCSPAPPDTAPRRRLGISLGVRCARRRRYSVGTAVAESLSAIEVRLGRSTHSSEETVWLPSSRCRQPRAGFGSTSAASSLYGIATRATFCEQRRDGMASASERLRATKRLRSRLASGMGEQLWHALPEIIALVEAAERSHRAVDRRMHCFLDGYCRACSSGTMSWPPSSPERGSEPALRPRQARIRPGRAPHLGGVPGAHQGRRSRGREDPGEAVIAKGSHITSWKALELKRPERICHDCGKPVRLEDVARLHWEHGKLSIRCVECMGKL